MKKEYNITDIAEQAGVSIATVSRAINGTGPVRESTKQRILQIAHELNFWGVRPSTPAGTSNTIGVILPDLYDFFYSNLLKGIDQEASKTNSSILVSSSHSDMPFTTNILQTMTNGQVNGLIVMVPVIHDEMMDYLDKIPLPIVLLNSGTPSKKYSVINIDNFQGAYAATEHLIGHGYENIGIIAGMQGNFDADDRLKGFRSALEDNNLPLIPELVAHQEFTTQGGYFGFTRLMSQKVKPRAIFCSTDMMALGAIEAATEMNIKIPEQVALCGFDNLHFDNIFFGNMLTPKLTTVHVPVSEVGANAVRCLLDMISTTPAKRKVISEKVSTGLVIRSSCGC